MAHAHVQTLQFSASSPSSFRVAPPSPPRRAGPRSTPVPSQLASSTAPPLATPASPAAWLSENTLLSSEIAIAESDLLSYFRAHADSASTADAHGIPWGDFLSSLQNSERVADAERASLRAELRTLRSPSAATAAAGFRERARRAFAILRADERASEASLSTRSVLEAVGAAEAVAALLSDASNVPQSAAGCGGAGVAESSGGNAIRNDDDDDDDDGTETLELGGNIVAGASLHTSAPASAPATPSRSGGDASAALRARVAEIDAADASAAMQTIFPGWNASAKDTEGAEDLAIVTATVSAVRAVGGDVGVEARDALLEKLAHLLPARSAPARAAALDWVLASRRRRAEKLRLVAEWRVLRGARGAVAAASSADVSFNASVDADERESNCCWRGPDALSRIAALEWRAQKREADARKAAAAATAIAAANAKQNAERAAKLAQSREKLRSWRTDAPPTPPRRENALSAGPSVGPPRAAIAVPTDATLLNERAERALAAAKEKRDAAAARAEAAAATALLRARGGVPLLTGHGSARTPSGNWAEGFGDALLPERPTAASARAATTVSDAAAAAAARANAAAHERKVASVRNASGRGFGMGSVGVRPALAVPSWRKGL